MSSADKFILAIDLGTSGPKVALLSVQGELIGSEFEETPVLLPPGGGAEQSPQVWWDAIETAGKRLLAKGLISNDDIVAIASTSQWSGTVAVDREGDAIGNAIIWMDSRGAPYIHKLMDGPLKVEGYALTKLIKWIRLTGGAPGNSGKDPLAHILYLQDVHPEIYQRAYKFLEPIDYIGLRLTGQFAASFNSITLNWMTDNRNIENVTYHDGWMTCHVPFKRQTCFIIWPLCLPLFPAAIFSQMNRNVPADACNICVIIFFFHKMNYLRRDARKCLSITRPNCRTHVRRQ
ncbi:FGGY family carbohydrate kinase [Candidatus Villigracilis proximus]|uniref:FGGY family carbohydrate kinase n=1 Tax=Candidatus Villigracilis proximus TaxID=3140683 RepID=UPI0031F1C348